MKKMIMMIMMIMVTFAAMFAATIQDDYRMEMRAAQLLLSSITNNINHNKSAMKDADKITLKYLGAEISELRAKEKLASASAAEAKQKAHSYKMSGLSFVTTNNAASAVLSRYNLGKRIHMQGKSFFPSEEEKDVIFSFNDVMLKGIKSTSDDNLKTQLVLQYLYERYGK